MLVTGLAVMRWQGCRCSPLRQPSTREQDYRMGTAVAAALGLVSLATGALLGAIVERSRARAGYLAKRYRDHVELLLRLTRSASIPTGSKDGEHVRQQVMDARPGIDADVWLFGNRSTRESLDAVHERITRSALDDLEPMVQKLALALRGPWYQRLAPQRRWFR
jgi:hypothetical protein